jgi:hypothetical protein
MLAREPRDRYQTASELIVDLDRSNLAAAVPSFIELDLALQDPLVRARLTTPAQPTCPDVDGAAAKKPAPSTNGNPDLWFLRYRDKSGQWCKAKATTAQLLQRLREGRMPAEVEASHQLQGKFQPLKAFPELREAAEHQPPRKKPAKVSKPVLKTTPSPRADTESQSPARKKTFPWPWWPIGIGAALIAGGGWLVYLLFLAS